GEEEGAQPLSDLARADGPVAGAEADPHGRFERRETVERALLEADRILTERQRGVLLLREVLGFSARETAQRLRLRSPR
ncbi:MAG TPA: hypothetical protein VFN91_06125, partial [Myxococcaceae bacterium]|nr:hypothetical protein [Myxococcaceae bacterium]